ncbi:hypothetical protein JW887_06535 [Candidatus Dojkabacteria bacterium]|nr:hypothetical protein [Candidatus Dojkabacteria bacterium]
MKISLTKSELNRRKIAFVSLLCAIFIGVVISSFVFEFQISWIVFVALFLVFLLSYFELSRFFKSLSGLRMRISDNVIERVNGASLESYLLEDLVRVSVKRRSNGDIREIGLIFNDGRALFIDGVEGNFEKILKKVKLYTEQEHRDIEIKEIREFMDFDHILFYPVLGLFIGFFSIYLLKSVYFAVFNLDYSSMKVFFGISSLGSLILGLYFIITKPISIRYGAKKVVGDWFWGIGMLGAAVFLFWIFLG